MRGAIVLLAGLALAGAADAAPPLANVIATNEAGETAQARVAVTAVARTVARRSRRTTAAPSVPAYAASHGCVRIPMWVAPSLFGTHDYGTTVVVHL